MHLQKHQKKLENGDIMEYLGLGCSQVVLDINNQRNTIYVDYGTVVAFKVCGEPNADFIIQDVGTGVGIGTGESGVGIGTGVGSGVGINLFYPYDVIDRGKLDSNGIYISSMPLNQVGTYVFRAGIYCTIADIDYCTQVSNAIVVTVLERGCTPNWQCKQPLNGYEYDANNCGAAERLAPRCNSTCGGVGCGDGGSSESSLLKIGIIAVVLGVVVYYSTKN